MKTSTTTALPLALALAVMASTTSTASATDDEYIITEQVFTPLGKALVDQNYDANDDQRHLISSKSSKSGKSGNGDHGIGGKYTLCSLSEATSAKVVPGYKGKAQDGSPFVPTKVEIIDYEDTFQDYPVFDKATLDANLDCGTFDLYGEHCILDGGPNNGTAPIQFIAKADNVFGLIIGDTVDEFTAAGGKFLKGDTKKFTTSEEYITSFTLNCPNPAEKTTASRFNDTSSVTVQNICHVVFTLQSTEKDMYVTSQATVALFDEDDNVVCY